MSDTDDRPSVTDAANAGQDAVEGAVTQTASVSQDAIPDSPAVDAVTDAAQGLASGSTAGLVEAAASAATSAVESAVSEIPGGGGAVGAVVDAAGSVAEGALDGGGAGATQAAIGSATSAGTGALSSALSDVPGGQVISQVVGAAAQIGQTAIQAALSRRDAPQASRAASSLGGGGEAPASSRAAEAILDAVAGAGGDADTEQVQVHFESDELSDVTWSVDRLELTETLGRPYEARLELRTAQLDTEPSRLLGSNATVLIERGALQQRCPGIISEVLEGNATGDYLSVHLTIVPALALLGQRRDTRIFQALTVPEILEAVVSEELADYEREVRATFDRAYPAREYCTQYDETDLDFALRLMEEEGIVAFFDCEGEKEVLVLIDNPERHEALEGDAIQMLDYQGRVGGHEYVSRFRVRSRVRPTRTALRHFDWTRTPTQSSPSASPSDPQPIEAEQEGTPAGEGEPPNGAATGPAREEYDHDSRPLTLSGYDDGGGTYQADDSADQARLRRELQARDARVGSGAGTVTGLRPGMTFELQGHRQTDLDGEYLATGVRHAFMVGDTEVEERYANEFDCLPVGVPFRPDRATPRPRIPGMQTATVVGPSGEEIHTDQHGRVKVQFHWDRQGQRDEQSSCWVRVMQPWAGAGWGFVFIPRIGMEVTVTFVNGDPDQPVVTGTLYNAANRPPLTLDDEKTRSTIKTRSTTQSEGWNELTFEDAAGEEQIIVHAQKDYNETVENNHSTTVHAGQTNTIDGDQSESVGGNQSMSVSGNRTKSVDKDETNTITQKRETTVDGLEKDTFNASREVRITGTDLHEVSDMLTEQIGGGRRTAIDQGDHRTVASGDEKTTVSSGQYLVTSAAQIKLTQGDTNFLRLDGLATLGTSGVVTVRNDATTVEGDTNGTLTLTASTAIKLECGAGSITVKNDGTIEVSGTTIELKSGGSGVKVEASGVTVNGATVTVGGGSMVNVSASVVKIN